MFEKILNQEFGALLQGRVGIARILEEQDRDGVFRSSRSRELEGGQRMKVEVRKKLLEAGVAEASIRISVSHTSTPDLTTIVVVGSELKVGVDLEPRSRHVHPQVLQRVTSKEERERLDWDVLKFWVVKEAAFKSNPDNLGTVLSQYLVVEWDPSARQGKVLLPDRKEGGSCRFRLLELGSWYIALAYIK